MRRFELLWLFALAAGALDVQCLSQSMPHTAGDTLSGQRIVLADAVQGRVVVLVAGFSREGGSGTGTWVKAMHSDPALNDVAIYQVAMLAGAPSLLRGVIKNGMKKGVAPAEQDHFVVLVQDEILWRRYFDVSVDKDPYVVLIDATAKILWHGHGAAAELESQLRAARR